MTQPPDSFPLFLSLPAEILSEIGAAVEAVEDCAHLRLTCKHVEACTFAAFARRFFRRRKFYRGPTSLAALLHISHSRLAPYLEHFVLGTELLSAYAPEQDASIDYDALRDAHYEQTSLLESRWDHHVLAQAFSRLPSLRVVEVEDFDDRFKHTSLTSRSRFIDIDNGGYRLRTLLDTLGFERFQVPEFSPFKAAEHLVVCVRTLLGALARSSTDPGAPRPRVLKIRARELIGNKHRIAEFISTEVLELTDEEVSVMGVSDEAFRIPPFLRPSVGPVVEALEELELDVYNHDHPDPSNQMQLTMFQTRNLLAFLGMPKRLRKLRTRRFAYDERDESRAAKRRSGGTNFGSGWQRRRNSGQMIKKRRRTRTRKTLPRESPARNFPTSGSSTSETRTFQARYFARSSKRCRQPLRNSTSLASSSESATNLSAALALEKAGKFQTFTRSKSRPASGPISAT